MSPPIDCLLAARDPTPRLPQVQPPARATAAPSARPSAASVASDSAPRTRSESGEIALEQRLLELVGWIVAAESLGGSGQPGGGLALSALGCRMQARTSDAARPGPVVLELRVQPERLTRALGSARDVARPEVDEREEKLCRGRVLLLAERASLLERTTELVVEPRGSSSAWKAAFPSEYTASVRSSGSPSRARMTATSS